MWNGGLICGIFFLYASSVLKTITIGKYISTYNCTGNKFALVGFTSVDFLVIVFNVHLSKIVAFNKIDAPDHISVAPFRIIAESKTVEIEKIL
jgi:hypothetical protein